jgi:two-component system, OmpR family, response regulator
MRTAVAYFGYRSLMLHASPRVLIVDDDERIRLMLSQFLQARGVSVRQAACGREMFAILQSSQIDAVLLDVMLPGEDGFALCRRLRSQSDVAIVMLTAMNEAAERVAGLELGADDYVAKPFDPTELLARIRAVLRRSANAPGRAGRAVLSYTFDSWTLDPRRRTLRSAADVLVDLTSGEFDLLLVFVEYPQQVLHRDRLLDLARGRANQAFDRSIDVQISRLRRKIEVNPAEPRLIKTVRNEGYFFTPDVRVLRPEQPV